MQNSTCTGCWCVIELHILQLLQWCVSNNSFVDSTTEQQACNDLRSAESSSATMEKCMLGSELCKLYATNA